uniref:Reverse transcriptase n=1 Tax=Nicotiana tabacum TaxID=4097 RepID=A0A1S4AGL4_TOBAC|nr:PREDICTED: uncharacterized protein LOC107797465 [Nicotiana tabacum]
MEICCNYKEHPNGRIWLLWKQNVEVQILLLDEHSIHCEVQERSSTFKTLITVVYESNEVNKRQQLWDKLVNLGATIKESWLLSGDFTNVIHTDDRIGAPVTQSEFKGFQDAIITLQLTQLKSLGWFYTWCNKQQLEKRIYSRIDWELGNVEWMQKYSHIEADFLNLEVSDHSPILLQCKVVDQKRNLHPKPFKLYSSVMDHADFAGIVENVWNQEVNGGNMHRVWNKLKDLKTELKELNTYTASYRLQLISPSRNLKPFRLKLRTNTNTINSIYTDLGDNVSDPILVEEEFVKFFRKLLGENNTTCECPNSEVIRQGPCLNMQKKKDLIKVVTRDEILQTIKDMPHDKALGVDGFPIEFFTRHWQVVGDDIYEAVKDFFVTGRLHKGVSRWLDGPRVLIWRSPASLPPGFQLRASMAAATAGS